MATRIAARRLLSACFAIVALLASGHPAYGQGKPQTLDAVTVSTLRDPVDKSYRRMVAGMDLFEKRHALAPAASLRFKLLPRKRDTDIEHVDLKIVGDSFATPVALAQDRTFVLERNERAIEESASVRPNRKAGTMTWRAEIRTPGLPPGTRRLGDLRLECEVGVEARLISNRRPFFLGWLDDALLRGAAYCHQRDPRYLLFADRPLFSVALVANDRREVVSVDRLYAGASRDPEWKNDLRFCDCEVLVDRTYFLPLGDESWPDDTLVEFQYMDDAPVAEKADEQVAAFCTVVEDCAVALSPALPGDDSRQSGEVLSARAAARTVAVGRSTNTDVRSGLGAALVVDFDSGYEVWVYKERARDKAAQPVPELVLLVAPSGIVTRMRIR